MTDRFDVAVVGAGIVGLAHAHAALARGRTVVVIDRADRIMGASVRNFGHVGTGMHTGFARELADLARPRWIDLAVRANFWLREGGSLTVARADDELAVLEESAIGPMLSAAEVAELAPVVGAVGGARSELDLQVDPRHAATAIANYLAAAGVEFRWRTSALGAQTAVLHSSRGDIHADTIIVAVNYDVDQLYPALAEEHGVERCTLDMLLADGVGLAMPLLTGSSMLRYSAFAQAPSAAALRARFAVDHPRLLELDINQMYTERPDGSLLVGDTHQRAVTPEPFQQEGAFETLEWITGELFDRPVTVRERWQGVYATAPEEFLVASPVEGVHVVSVTTGIGMTTGLGLGEHVIAGLFDNRPQEAGSPESTEIDPLTAPDIDPAPEETPVPARFELAVLDMAGTTVVDDGVVEAAFVRAWDAVRSTDEGRAEALDHVRATMGQSKIEVFRAIMPEEAAQEVNIAFEQSYRDLIAEGRCEAIPGAEDAIRALKSRGIAVVFTTGFSHETADAIVDALGWGDLVDLVLTPADAGRGRPAPDLPLTAVIRTRTSAVAAMVVVGDTESDAGSGVAAGAGLVVGVLTGSRDAAALRAAGAHEVIASIADLPALVL